MRAKVRRTNGESSVSTSRVCRADDARRWVGSGREMVLFKVSVVVLVVLCARYSLAASNSSDRTGSMGTQGRRLVTRPYWIAAGKDGDD